MVHWYKRDPDAAIAGMIGLTMEERGAYNTLIDLLYARDGDVPNDDQFMARAQQCRPQQWRRVRDSLIAKGKVRIKTDGKLTANRVETTLKEARNFSESQSLKAKKRWESKPDPLPAGNASTTTTTSTKKDGSHLSTKQQPTIARATQFPQGWVFGEIEFAAAVAIRPNWTRIKGDHEFTRFHDHALAKGSAYKNWPAAWRNWVGSKFQDNQGGGNGRGQSLTELAFELAAEVRERERDAGITRPDDALRRD